MTDKITVSEPLQKQPRPSILGTIGAWIPDNDQTDKAALYV